MGGEIVRKVVQFPAISESSAAELADNAANNCVSSLLSSRPKSLNDVTAQDHTITVLQRTLQASNV